MKQIECVRLLMFFSDLILQISMVFSLSFTGNYLVLVDNAFAVHTNKKVNIALIVY